MSGPRDRTGRSDLEGASIAKFSGRTQPQWTLGAKGEWMGDSRPGVKKKGASRDAPSPLSRRFVQVYQTKNVPRLKVSDSVDPLKVVGSFTFAE
jgi:hypothetical protein